MPRNAKQSPRASHHGKREGSARQHRPILQSPLAVRFLFSRSLRCAGHGRHSGSAGSGRHAGHPRSPGHAGSGRPRRQLLATGRAVRIGRTASHPALGTLLLANSHRRSKTHRTLLIFRKRAASHRARIELFGIWWAAGHQHAPAPKARREIKREARRQKAALPLRPLERPSRRRDERSSARLADLRSRIVSMSAREARSKRGGLEPTDEAFAAARAALIAHTLSPPLLPLRACSPSPFAREDRPRANATPATADPRFRKPSFTSGESRG